MMFIKAIGIEQFELYDLYKHAQLSQEGCDKFFCIWHIVTIIYIGY